MLTGQAIAFESKNYLPSVRHQWTLVNHFYDVSSGVGFPADMASAQFAYRPFTIGKTQWQIEWRLPSGGLWIKRVGGEENSQNDDEEILSFRLSSVSGGRQLYGPKDFALVFTSARQEAHIDSFEYARYREMPFTLEAFVRPEIYVAPFFRINRSLPCDFRVVVLDKNDAGKEIAEFAAHRWILSLRSPVFEAMLAPESKFEEAKTGVIRIGNFSPETVRAILSFIYTRQIGVCKRGDPYFYEMNRGDFAEVMELLDAAEQYQIGDDFKNRCGVRLLALFNHENAVEVLAAAERYHLNRLLKHVMMNHIRAWRRQIILPGQNDEALKRLSPETLVELIKALSADD